MIKVTGLTRRYADFTALDDVSFTIENKQIVGLLGHNGAGKSTMMKLLTGSLEPTSGSIQIDGNELAMNRRELQRNMGYLPENCPLYADMTVIDYLLFQAGLRGYETGVISNMVRSAIDRSGLHAKAMNRISTLSRGYRQRVGVAQAIMHKPDILVLDEPTNGLDPAQIFEMRNLIKQAAQTATVIVSTHILQEVEAVCDRVLILRSGKLVLDTPLDTLQQTSRLEVIADVDSDQGLELFASFGQVTQEGECFVIETEAASTHDVAAQIATRLAAHAIPLYRLQHRTDTLETLFRQVQEYEAGTVRE